MTRIALQKKVLGSNDALAADVRSRLTARHIVAVNLMGSPGSGKTSLIETTARLLRQDIRAAALTGDQATEHDAQRIRAAGIPAIQITTGDECHLNAGRVLDVIDAPELAGAHLLFIENVGNLICPAPYDLGETAKVVVLSAAEGDDKPAKYPALFRRADLLVINKLDLVPFTDFDVEHARRSAMDVAPHLEIVALSCRTGEGLSAWSRWLEQRLAVSP